MTHSDSGLRIDKWLWAARFYKTRSLAAQKVRGGQVQVGGAHVKPAYRVAVGELITLQQGRDQREVVVRGLSRQRGPAPVAQQLYEETPASLAQRAQRAEMRRLAPDPARAIRSGRPTKRDRRALQGMKRQERWSATLDDDGAD